MHRSLFVPIGAAVIGALAFSHLAASEAQSLSLIPSAQASQFMENPDLIADIAESALPSVVSIQSTSMGRARGERDRFDLFGPMGPQRGAGSGVIVQADGLILTNNHVIEGADSLRVSLSDGREFEAEVVGRDPASDLGILRLLGDHVPTNLPTMSLADSDGVRLGQVVLAVGNPFGLSGTVTMGIVSATGRGGRGLVDYGDFIQTDAAINPGNSGGALVDLEGRLIGINTAIMSRSGGYNGVGFAIPSNLVGDVMGSILEHGHMVRGWLGVSIQDVNEDIARAFGADVADGALIADVMPDTPAARAGLISGDIVVAVDDQSVGNAEQFKNVIALRGVRAVKLSVVRDGRPRVIKAYLEQKSEETAASTDLAEPVVDGPLAGVKLVPLDATNAERFGASTNISGVVVAEVSAMSGARRAGLAPGDVIVSVNREPVHSLKDVAALLANEGPALLQVVRGDQSTFLLVR